MNNTLFWPAIRIYLIALSMAWISLSVLVGLFYSFEVLETSNSIETETAFRTAIKVAIPLIMIGVVAFGIPLFVFLQSKRSTR
jgi:hypothetical protein